MAYRLIIKGDKFKAAQAAAARGIPLAFVRETSAPEWMPDTIGDTAASYETVAAWFGEPPHAAPFPVGSLLSFCEIKREE